MRHSSKVYLNCNEVFYHTLDGLGREIVADADKDGTGQLTIQEFTNCPKVTTLEFTNCSKVTTSKFTNCPKVTTSKFTNCPKVQLQSSPTVQR